MNTLYLLYTLCYNKILCYLFCFSDSSSFGHWKLFQIGSSVLLTCFIAFIFFQTSFLFGIRRYSRLILSLPSPRESAISPFLGKRYLEIKIRVLGVLIAIRIPLLLDPLSFTLGSSCFNLICVAIEKS